MKIKPIFADILMAIAAAAVSVTLLSVLNFRTAFILTGPVMILAGFIRGNSNQNRIVQTAVLASPFYLLFAAVLNGVFHLFFLILLAITGVALGLSLRKWHSGKRSRLIVYSVLFLAYIFSATFYFMPMFLMSTLWREENRAAPAFKLVKPDKDTLHSSSLKNKILIVNFWTTWCGPCKEELPELAKIYQDYSSSSDITFLIVDAGKGKDTYEKFRSFISASQHHLPFYFDPEGKASDDFKSFGFPTTFLVDRSGNIRQVHTGYVSAENFAKEFRKKLDAIIQEEKK